METYVETYVETYTVSYNKSKLIDYIILFSLMLRNKNIYFPNIFYKEWAMYLIPKFKKNTHKDYCKINEIIPRYNFNDNFLKIFNILYKDKNIYVSIISKKINIDNIKLIKSEILIYKSVDFIVNNLLNYRIDSFSFELEEYIIKKINTKLTFKNFDKSIKNAYEESYGLFMSDYLFSNPIKKIIYFYIFKKIILRII